MPATTDDTHATLSPSSSKGWLHCPYFAYANASKGEPTNEKHQNGEGDPKLATDRGTVAHELAEMALNRYTNGDSKNITDDDFKNIKEYSNGTEFMDDKLKSDAQQYVDYVCSRIDNAKDQDPNYYVGTEMPVDISKYAPGSFGTSDSAVVYGDTIEISDFKSGKVPVTAVGNTQERLYALGVYEKLKDKYPGVKKIRMNIIQPNSDDGATQTSDTIGIDELQHWADETVKPAAKIAYEAANNKGTAGDGKDVERVAGYWCDSAFCKDKSTCPAYKKLEKDGSPTSSRQRRTDGAQELDKRPVFTPYQTTTHRVKTSDGFKDDGAYLKRYYSVIDAEVYFGNEYVEEVCDITWATQQKTAQLFGYNSYTTDEVVQGVRTVSGQFSIRFISPNYLFQLLKSAEQPSISHMKTYTVPTYSRDELMPKGDIDTRMQFDFSEDNHHPIWPQTFDIDVIFGEKSGAGDAVHVILTGVKLTGSSIQISAAPGKGCPPLTEVYSFVAKDIKTVGNASDKQYDTSSPKSNSSDSKSVEASNSDADASSSSDSSSGNGDVKDDRLLAALKQGLISDDLYKEITTGSSAVNTSDGGGSSANAKDGTTPLISDNDSDTVEYVD